MGEAINLVENFKVEKVIFNCGPHNDLEKELIKVLDKKKIKYYSCIRELNIDNNKLHFLQTKEYDNENDNSNVIYTELNGYKFMFMGDASGTTEKEMLNKYNLPDIDVLKAGHHGSKTSSSKEFIDTINPKYSIISVGKNNMYGHPNKEVLSNLKDSKIYINLAINIYNVDNLIGRNVTFNDRYIGEIINMSSIAGRICNSGSNVYATTKAGIMAITSSVARELAPYNVNVNSVLPGIVRTNMWEGILDDFTNKDDSIREETFKQSTAAIPLGRPQTVGDIASMVLYLASDEAKNITAQNIAVDGGYTFDI